MTIEKVNVQQKFSLFSDTWSPKIIGELNDNYIKVAKFKGEFVWHTHEEEDELFFVVKGQLMIKLRDKDITLNPGEFVIIPKGVEHKPVATNEVLVMLVEAKSTLNTGDKTNQLTQSTLDQI